MRLLAIAGAAFMLAAGSALAAPLDFAAGGARAYHSQQCSAGYCQAKIQSSMQLMAQAQLPGDSNVNFGPGTDIEFSIDGDTFEFELADDPSYTPGKRVATVKKLSTMGGVPVIITARLEWNQNRARLLLLGESTFEYLIPRSSASSSKDHNDLFEVRLAIYGEGDAPMEFAGDYPMDLFRGSIVNEFGNGKAGAQGLQMWKIRQPN